MNEMKKILCFLLLLVFFCLTSQAKNIRIEDPPFVYQGQGFTGLQYTVFVYRGHDETALLKAVERNDTATIVELQMGSYLWKRFDPTICLRDERGRQYFIRNIEGDYDIRIGQHFTAPKKGNFIVRLVFPPLPKRVHTIDLTETGGRGEWGFFGIRIDGTPLPPMVLPKELERKLSTMPAAGDTLPIPKIHFGMATVRGHLLEYRPGMKEQVCLRIGASSYQIKAPCDTILANVLSSGDFIVQVPLTHLTPIEIPLGDQDVFFYAEPDRETELYINMREVSRRRRYGSDSISAPLAYITSGPLARLSTEWNQLKPTVIEQGIELEKQARSLADSLLKEPFAISIQKLKEHLMNFFACHAASRNGSPQMRQLLALNDSLVAVHFISGILQNVTREREKQRNANRPGNGATQEELDQWRREWGDYWIDADTVEMEHIKIYMRQLQDPRQLLCPPFYDRIVRFLQQLPVLLPELFDNELKARTLQGLQMDKLTPIDSLQQEQELAALPQDYRNYLKYFSDKLARLTEENRHRTGYTIHDLIPPNLKWDEKKKIEEQLMSLTIDSIIAPYRGHPIYVQMWNSSPIDYGSRLNRYAVIPMQKRLADSQAVFVFIDFSFSYQPAWKQQIAQLRGEHYPLPSQIAYQNIVKQLTNDFTDYVYMVFDAEGQRIYPATCNGNSLSVPDFDEIERLLRQ